MGLDRLRGLHGAMRDYGIDRCTFPFERNGERFHVFFFTDRDPFGLMFGHVSGQFSSRAIPQQVTPGHEPRLHGVEGSVANPMKGRGGQAG